MTLLMIPAISAATIHGTVYDFSLNEAENVKISIDTEPEQVIIASTYSFEVSPGAYLITAEQLENGKIVSKTKELIKVTKDGDFTYDLILFPKKPKQSESQYHLNQNQNLTATS